ncbi:MAG TPA: phosphoribosyltransferase family protein, partial [Candidatus Hydrogenedentes bacterium]|nr:phosphoribosyltransferase family protein [Candidatus Hydrogenedentota bacterium]
MQLGKEPLISSEAIRKRTADLAERISKDFDGLEVTAIVVLKGALPFAADLIRRLRIPVRLEFIRAKSYAGAVSTGKIDLLHKPEEPLAGKHLLVIEDILDTGRTAAAIMDYLRAIALKPSSPPLACHVTP